MGYPTYNEGSRNLRAASVGYFTKSASDIFTQSKEKRVHESMDPMGLKVRECRDSDNHPSTTPIVLGLDVTLSMGDIPVMLIKDGLPTLMSTLIQKGVPDAAVCFLGVGDHECDRAPLQVGQFESGDVELDLYLTRTWLEGGGGGNAGESYQLAWLFASRHTVTDAWEKRKQKGLLFTIGDEPVLPNLPASAVRAITGEKLQGNLTTEQLLKEAQERWNVFHIIVVHSNQAHRSIDGWEQLLGQNCILVADYTEVPKKIAEIVLSHTNNTPKTGTGEGDKPSSTTGIIL